MRALPICLALLSACSAIPGSITVDVTWAPGQPRNVPATAVYFASILKKGASGQSNTLVQQVGPAGSHGQLSFPSVLNDSTPELMVAVELRASSATNAPVLYDGVSAPFALTAGENKIVTVQLGTLPAAPDTGPTGKIVYSRSPWGSKAANAPPPFTVSGTAGAVAPGAMVAVYDGPETSQAVILGSQAAGDTGAFTAVLSPVDRPIVYVGTIDGAGNPSAVAAAHMVNWTADFGGKVAGSTLANPNVMLANSAASLVSFPGDSTENHAPLFGVSNPGPLIARELTDYSGLLPGTAAPSTTSFAPHWLGPAAEAVYPPGRDSFAAAYDSARGVTVIFGGTGAAGALDDTWEWDGTVWNQAFSGAGPVARSSHSMAYDSRRGVTVLFGGIAASSSESCATQVPPLGYGCGDTWEWDGVSWTQRFPAVSPVAREAAGMAYDAHRGVTVLFGGSISFLTLPLPPGCSGMVSPSGLACNDTWEWNGASWARTALGMEDPPPRSGHAMAYDSVRGRTVLFGGVEEQNSMGTGPASDTWEWDGAAWTQAHPVTSPPARNSAAMSFDPLRGVSVLFGGQGLMADLGDTWDWNGQSWTQESPEVSPAARTGQAMAYDSARGATLVLGGTSAAGLLDDVWTLTGGKWTQTAPGGGPPVRYGHTLTYDSNSGTAMLFGGIGTSTIMMMGEPALNDSWVWNGSLWNELNPASAPSGRLDHAAAFDSQRGVSVLFGGITADNTALGDTWEWDGVNWSQLEPAVSPLARSGHGMAYDSARGVTVLYGGWAAMDSTLYSDTWEWNGMNWVLASPTASPGPRADFGMAYDPVRGKTVLFGGANTFDAPQDDTWEWDGSNWTRASPALAPAARLDPAVAFDMARGVMLLFGGTNGADNLPVGDLWAWDGVDWTKIFPSPTVTPTARSQAAMVFDSQRGVAVLFGGESDEPLGDTWLLPTGTTDYPMEVAQFDFSASGESSESAQVQQLTLSVNAGGTGYAPDGGTPLDGTVLAAWDWSAGGNWRVLGVDGVDPTAPANVSYTTGSTWEAERFVLSGAPETINVAVFPKEPTGNIILPGEIAVGDPQVTVQYIHSESPCTATAETTCACGSDESACAPDGGAAVCSDYKIDPLNCGGCAAQGAGVACTRGMSCAYGYCTCPCAEVICGAACSDLQLDPLNCGACGNSCAVGQRCIAGVCK